VIDGHWLCGRIRRDLPEALIFWKQGPSREVNLGNSVKLSGPADEGLNGFTWAVNGLGCSLQGRLFHGLPADLPTPLARYETLAEYPTGVAAPKAKVPQTASPWTARPKYFASLFKPWYGEHGSKDSEFGYCYVPERSGSYSWMHLFDGMHAGTIEGLTWWGMNPAVRGSRSAMALEIRGYITGDSTNMTTPRVYDTNTMIPEYTPLLCNISKTS
jgi:hypothetical protein